MPKVSIIVPVYNAIPYLKKTVQSILKQSFVDFELICVDDGSTDSSLAELRHFAEVDSRVIVINQANQSAGVARNNGLKIANGEYVIFLDADDLFDRHLLEKMLNKIERFHADICICKAWAVYSSNVKASLNYNNKLFALNEDKVINPQEITKDIFTSFSVETWNKLYRKEFILDNGLQFQSTRKTNDLFFNIVSLALAKRIVVVNEELIDYRVDNRFNIITEFNEKQLGFYRALKAIKEHLFIRGGNNSFLYSFYKMAMEIISYNICFNLTKEVRLKMVDFMTKTGFQELGINKATIADQDFLLQLQFKTLHWDMPSIMYRLVYKIHKAQEYYVKNGIRAVIKKIMADNKR